MATRKSTLPIPAFPSHVSREHFASWLSGFADGEACFTLDFVLSPKRQLDGTRRKTPCANFRIKLRLDDRPVLELIRSFWQCGGIHDGVPAKTSRQSNPFAAYAVSSSTALVTRTIPHFDHYPLFAKKQTDYVIWREAVLFWHRISQRPQTVLGWRYGSLPRWQPNEIAWFAKQIEALKQQRIYKP